MKKKEHREGDDERHDMERDRCWSKRRQVPPRPQRANRGEESIFYEAVLEGDGESILDGPRCMCL